MGSLKFAVGQPSIQMENAPRGRALVNDSQKAWRRLDSKV